MTVLSKKKSKTILEDGEPSSTEHGHGLPLSTTQPHSQVRARQIVLWFFKFIFENYIFPLQNVINKYRSF